MSSTSSAPPWNVQRLPGADGRVFLVTGGNAGIGYFVAEQLSATGAAVVLGSRNPAKAQAATASIPARVHGARVRAVRLDLADLSSLETAVESLEVERLDAVVHNAGVALDDPPRKETGDGHELMFGTNHLGHFVLAQWLMPLLSAAPAARVVTMGSFAAKSERLTSTTCSPGRTTSPSAPTDAPSWPRCTSASNSTAACALPAARWRAWWSIPAARRTPSPRHGHRSMCEPPVHG